MRDDDERRVELAIELEHEIENLPCVGTIEISGRLVGQYDGRLRDERACDGGPLTLSARKLARSVLDPLAQPHPLEQLVRTRARFLDGHPTDEQGHGNVLERRELGQQMMELINEPERAVAQVTTLRVGQLVDGLA